MNWWIFGGVAIGIVVIGWLLQHFRLIDLTPTRRGRGGLGGMVTMVDEVFAPTKHEAAIEADRETRMPAPAPIPGDGDKGIFGGKVVIEVPKDEGRAR
ncbi:hypothetical protein GCM10022239_04570 [Leifsonia bigeumensis]|uniref:Uncharacterized protein n=1 Tax=Leifsonella bigeumensis TaxID=433643 RepID=A0ABP7F502_9MICO